MNDESRPEPPSLLTGIVDFLFFFLGFFVGSIFGFCVTCLLFRGPINFISVLIPILGGFLAGAAGGTFVARLRANSRPRR